MIVRDARRQSIDYGPTPGRSHVPVSGSLVTGKRPYRPPAGPEQPPVAGNAAYKRAYRARIKLDAERYAREMARERERMQRRRHAA